MEEGGHQDLRLGGLTEHPAAATVTETPTKDDA
jgi:hypothetical protein